MTRWRLETSAQFDKAARKLDRQTVRRVKVYLEEICELEDPRSRGKGLTDDLTGYWRYRIGDYRVIVEIRDHALVIVAIALGQRPRVPIPMRSSFEFRPRSSPYGWSSLDRSQAFRTYSDGITQAVPGFPA